MGIATIPISFFCRFIHCGAFDFNTLHHPFIDKGTSL
jgi:hypothetical protein